MKPILKQSLKRLGITALVYGFFAVCVQGIGAILLLVGFTCSKNFSPDYEKYHLWGSIALWGICFFAIFMRVDEVTNKLCDKYAPINFEE